MERYTTGYGKTWAYRKSFSLRVLPCFEQAVTAGYCAIPCQGRIRKPHSLYQMLRAAMAWLRDHHGTSFYGVVSLRHLPDGVAITSRGTPRTMRYTNANGDTQWVHGPPPIPDPPRK